VRSRFDGRALSIVLLLGTAGLVAAEARAVSLPPAPVGAVHLVKARHEGLHFHWQAVVSQEGGTFVLTRRGESGREQAWQAASRLQRSYELTWKGPAISGAYELRFRGRDGQETLLATLLVNCHTYEPGERTSGGVLHARPPLIAPALPAPAPVAVWATPLEPASTCRSLLRAPPAPPPRGPHRTV
jgi:hypothetical protein